MYMKFWKIKRGIAIVIALVMLTLLFILGMTFITASGKDYIYAKETQMRMQAFYLAESGVEYAVMKRINWTQYPHHEEVELADGKFVIDVTEAPDKRTFTVVSRGVVSVYQKTLLIKFGEDGSILEWKEL